MKTYACITKRRNFAVLSSLLLLIMLLASACRPAPTPTEPAAPPPTDTAVPAVEDDTPVPTEIIEPTTDLAPELGDKLWLLVAYGNPENPTVVEEGTVVTALFASDGNLSGSGGCNNFSTTYELNGDELSVGVIASTMMACEKGMDQESAVLAALQSARRIAFTPEGRLEVFYETSSGSEEKLIYTEGETPLVETVWVLQTLGTPESLTSVESGTVITAIFSPEGTLSGSSGCNNYSASYTVQDDQMEIQQPISTLMACTQGMEQEAAYQNALMSVESFEISGATLELRYDGGAGTLVFTSRSLPLENTLWTLTTVNGTPNTIGLAPTTALFDPGTEPGKGALGGVAMCNNYQTDYTLEAEALTVGEFATTMIRCPQTVMQAEATYLEILGAAQSYQVFGQTLIITSEVGNLIFAANRAPLEGTNWRLNSLGPADNPQAPVAGGNFTALFVRQPEAPSGLMVGSTGCNDYNAVYVAGLTEIKINPPARSDNPGCPAGLPDQELQYFQALNAATSYRILGDNLQINYGDGEVLSFTAFVPAPPEPITGPLTGLNGTRWWLISMGNTAVLPGSQVTAEFAINPDGETGTINGNASCNNYNAPVLGVFQVGPAASTKMLCPDPAGIMEQEAAYLAMLSTANSFSQAYNQLLIGTPTGLLVYYNSPAPVVTIPPPTALPPLPATVTPVPGTPEPTGEPTEEPIATEVPETTEPPTETETVVPPPVAVISAPTEGDVSQAITFDASGSTSEGEITGYSWDFGDGGSAMGATAEHAFAAPGIYTVTLTVTDADGRVGTATQTITIN